MLLFREKKKVSEPVKEQGASCPFYFEVAVAARLANVLTLRRCGALSTITDRLAFLREPGATSDSRQRNTATNT